VQRRDVHSDNSLIVGFNYVYDRESNKNSEAKQHSPTNSELYGYDSVYRLTSFARGQLNVTGTGIVGPPSATEAWALDGVGNWRIDTVNGAPGPRSVNSVNEYTNVNGGALVYDQNGNLTAAGLGYQWDYRNRLRQVCSLPAGATSCSAAGAQLLATYSYDALNRRTRKVVTNSGALNGTTNFYYDGWNVIEERDGSDSLTQQYVFGIEMDEPVVLDRAGGQRYFYHQNTLESVYALTDTGGNVVEGYRYDAYGQQTVLQPDFTTPIGSTSTVGNPYMYTGQRFDAETGLFYYKMRYYSAALGRFISRDPRSYPPDSNLFEYVGSSPTNFVDPFGKAKKWESTFTNADYTNCFAHGMREDQNTGPAVGQSLKAFMEAHGWTCKDKGKASADCTCKCDQYMLMLYIYAYPNNPQNKDTFTDPWIYGGGNDAHVIRCDYEAVKGAAGNYKCADKAEKGKDPWSQVKGKQVKWKPTGLAAVTVVDNFAAITDREYETTQNNPAAQPVAVKDPDAPNPPYWGDKPPTDKYCCCKDKK